MSINYIINCCLQDSQVFDLSEHFFPTNPKWYMNGCGGGGGGNWNGSGRDAMLIVVEEVATRIVVELLIANASEEVNKEWWWWLHCGNVRIEITRWWWWWWWARRQRWQRPPRWREKGRKGQDDSGFFRKHSLLWDFHGVVLQHTHLPWRESH